MAKKAIPLPVPIEEPEDECPKCPPVGAPAWMATFADIATLLMAFFVLILSFAEFNQPKFKQVAGSLSQSFGVQRELPVMEQPMGTTIMDLTFSPSPTLTVTQELKQQTTDTNKKTVETQEKDGETTQSEENEIAQQLAQALTEALQSGMVSVNAENSEITLRFEQPPAETSAEDAKQILSDQIAEAAEAIDQAQEQTGASAENVALQGLTERLKEIAEMTSQGGGPAEQESDTEGDQQFAGGAGDAETAKLKAAVAEARLKVALRQEIGEGLVDVQTEEDRVVITVGAGGAFPSGSAELTGEARDIMSRVAFASMNQAGDIKVTGHTDNVPLNPNSPLRDNWGLSAARASSVVREFGATGLIDPSRLQAIGAGETEPVGDNNTAEGREKNRRIEIEITY